MLDGAISAVAALRVLRNSIEARLQENEDFRVLQALDQALAEIDRPKLPKVRQLQTELETTAQSIRSDCLAPSRKLLNGRVDSAVLSERRKLPC